MIRPKRFKISRRVGERIYPQTQTARYSASLARKIPTKKRGGSMGGSEYGVQLIEKQKVRFAYGVSERQFSNYVNAARHTKGQLVTAVLYQMLESRLDNVVYRLGFASSRRAARQMVSHGHITVNGRRVTIPSYAAKKDDIIGVRAGSRVSSLFGNLSEKLKEHQVPEWLLLKGDALEGHIVAVPKDTLSGLNTIVEFYSR